MFDLESSIAEWRRKMADAGIGAGEVLDELEGHLRDHVEAQMESGMNAEKAFEAAVGRIGPGVVLRDEFQEANRTESMNEQKKKQLRGALIIIALIAVEVSLLLPALAKWKALGNTAASAQFFTEQLAAVCLMICLPLSLVLPLMVGALAPRDAGNVMPIMLGAMEPQETGKAKRWLRTVWAGQILIGVGGLCILLLPQHPVFGLLFANVVCAVCAFRLRRELRASGGVAS